MQFCTLDEAWGNNKEYFTNNKKEETMEQKNLELSSDSTEKEPFVPAKKQPKKIYYNATEESLFENFTDTINDKRERDKLIQKVLKSRRCRDVLRKKFRPNLINKLILILDDYRDVIVLVLIGFCIVVFLNMLYNINKRN